MTTEDHRTDQERLPLRDGHAAGRWVVPTSVAISVVVHLFALWLYPVLMRRAGPEGDLYWYIPPEYRPEGTEVVNLAPFAEMEAIPDVEEPEEPEPEEVPVTPQPEPEPVRPPAGIPVRDPTPAEVLRPQEGDPSLWRPLDPALLELPEEELLRLRLEGRLEAWTDSVSEARAREEEALDWTYTDEEGKRWGVSPGQLHLGDITIPFPFAFSAPPSNRESQRRAWEWDQIQQGAAAMMIRESQKERAAAIRARMEAERRQSILRRKSQPPPDTTRTNRR